jgi:hypothetical protein
MTNLLLLKAPMASVTNLLLLKAPMASVMTRLGFDSAAEL